MQNNMIFKRFYLYLVLTVLIQDASANISMLSLECDEKALVQLVEKSKLLGASPVILKGESEWVLFDLDKSECIKLLFKSGEPSLKIHSNKLWQGGDKEFLNFKGKFKNGATIWIAIFSSDNEKEKTDLLAIEEDEQKIQIFFEKPNPQSLVKNTQVDKFIVFHYTFPDK